MVQKILGVRSGLGIRGSAFKESDSRDWDNYYTLIEEYEQQLNKNSSELPQEEYGVSGEFINSISDLGNLGYNLKAKRDRQLSEMVKIEYFDNLLGKSKNRGVGKRDQRLGGVNFNNIVENLELTDELTSMFKPVS